jgi:hypothetical protein
MIEKIVKTDRAISFQEVTQFGDAVRDSAPIAMAVGPEIRVLLRDEERPIFVQDNSGQLVQAQSAMPRQPSLAKMFLPTNESFRPGKHYVVAVRLVDGKRLIAFGQAEIDGLSVLQNQNEVTITPEIETVSLPSRKGYLII